jgi:hypothetical protein
MTGTDDQDLLDCVSRSFTTENVGDSVANVDSFVFADRGQAGCSHWIWSRPGTRRIDDVIGGQVDNPISQLNSDQKRKVISPIGHHLVSIASRDSNHLVTETNVISKDGPQRLEISIDQFATGGELPGWRGDPTRGPQQTRSSWIDYGSPVGEQTYMGPIANCMTDIKPGFENQRLDPGI